jgi:hypothetical protein
MAGRVRQVPTSPGQSSSGSAGRPQRLLWTGVLTSESRAGVIRQVAGRPAKLAGSPKLLRKVEPLGGRLRPPRPPAGFNKIRIPRRVFGGAHLHLYKPGLLVSSRKFLAAFSLARFLSPFAHHDVHCFKASPLLHPATPLLTELAVLSSSWPLRAGPASAGRLTPLRAPGPAAPRPGSPWHGGHAVCFPPFSSVTPSSLCSWLGSTRMGLLHAHSGSRPRLGTCPVTVQRSRGESVPGHVTAFPRSRLAVTVPRYRTSPGSRPISSSRPPGHVPPTANPYHSGCT